MVFIYNRLVRSYRKDPANLHVKVALHHTLVAVMSLNLLLDETDRRDFFEKTETGETIRARFVVCNYDMQFYSGELI